MSRRLENISANKIGAISGFVTDSKSQPARPSAESLQSAIFNSVNFSSIATDASGVIQIFNVGAECMLGYTALEVVNNITPADISDPQEIISRAKTLSVEFGETIKPGFEALVFKASREIEDIYELTYVRKDGSRFPAVVSVTALRDTQRSIIGYLLIGTDNTARKRADNERLRLDQSLRDLQFYTRSLIESSIDALMTTDPRGIITDVNKQMEALTGCTRDELIGAPFKDHFTDPERAEASIKKVLAEGKVTNYELTVVSRVNKEAVVSYNATILYDRNRHPLGVLAAARDITQRKQVESQERKEAESQERKHIWVAHINRILQMLTTNAPLASVLDTVVRDVEAFNPNILCSILLLDNDGKHLRHGAAPSLPDFYNEAIAGITIGPSVGSCGTAAFTGQRVIVREIENNPMWILFRDLAKRAGLSACWSQPILSVQGKVIGTFAVYHHHPYEPTAAEIQLIENEAHLVAIAIERTASETRLQLAASVFSHAREGIMITDATGTIIEVNATFSLVTGYSHDEAVGRDLQLLESGRQAADFYATMWQTLNSKGHWYGELWNRRKSGELYAEMRNISAVRDGSGKIQNFVALFTDITSLKEHQNQLERIAHFDSLTGLPNRLLLADRLQQAIVQCERHQHSLGLAYLDLDHFKEINDKYGHTVGDTLLIELSQRMKDALRDGDTLARIGGDEFVAILTDLEHTEDCYPVIERLLHAAAGSVTVRTGVDDDGNIQEAVLQASASIGVTIFPKHGADADQLLRHADQAMYLAKQAGKNRYRIYDAAQDAAIQSRHESLTEIRLALENDEFVLFYQPKVNIKTGAVIGAEALIRWQHPERGLLSPALFLLTIEDDQLIVDLGEWVITNALSQMSAWKTNGHDIPVSVNISARQLQDPSFTARLSDLMNRYPDLSPDCLELEILETSALADIVHVSEIMRSCQALGVRFALDDFGTGYSSLTYLQRLPAEVLKIDQSFIFDMINNSNDLAIVQGVVGLASAFHRNVIAEGVETESHGALLLSIGCELAQGYGIAKPMPAADFIGWMISWNSNAVWVT